MQEPQLKSQKVFTVKLLLLAGATLILFLWMNPTLRTRVVFRSTSSLPGVEKLLFLLTFLMAWGALLATAFAHRLWAALFMTFFAVNILVSTTYARIMGRSMNLYNAQTMCEAVGNILDAVCEYWRKVLLVGLMILVLVGFLLWIRSHITKRNTLPLLACSLSVSLAYVVMLARGGENGMRFFPANFESGMHALALSVEPFVSRLSRKAARPIPIVAEPMNPTVKHVVLVIDESIEGHVFREAMKTAHIENAKDLGIAYSYANNSAASNLLLRRLADPEAPEQSITQFPSAFELAKRHGFSTNYLDVQGVLGDVSVHDYFDGREKSFIDNNPPSKDYGTRCERDINAARILLDLLPTQDKSFTIINKVGTHFPYRRNLPPEMMNAKDAYQTSVARTSINFLAMIARSLPTGTLVFYTSDHGQNFKSRCPHANGPENCSVSEFQVPLVVLYSPDMKAWANHIRPEWRDCATHAAMAECVRNLFGERDPAVASLLVPPPGVDRVRNHVYFGSPRGMFGKPILSLWIDKRRQAFAAFPQPLK